MFPQKPKIKSLYPIYKVTDDLIRIGAEPNVTADVDNSDGMMHSFLELLDGTRRAEDIVAELRKQYPETTMQDVLDGLHVLMNLNFIEDASHTSDGLSACDLERYSRNIKYFEHFASAERSKYSFQEKLNASKVCVLGLGGHGSSIVFQLAALGVRHIVAVDHDILELSNLNRLVFCKEPDLGLHKADIARARLKEFAAHLELEIYQEKVNGRNVSKFIRGCDLVISAIDQPYAQIDRWVSETCFKEGIPCIFTAHLTATGRYYSIDPKTSGCIDCMIGQFIRNDPLFAQQFWGLARDGLVRQAHQAVLLPNLSVLTGMVAAEAVRYLTRHQEPLSTGKMVEVNFLQMTSQAFFDWPKYTDCPTCGHGHLGDWPFFQELERFSLEQTEEDECLVESGG